MSTLRDVAAVAGVSIKTVSNVVNGYEHVRPSTRTKVEAAIAELGYQPNLAARNLRAGRTGVIGLAVPELRFSYFAELADAVLAAARERGYVVLIEQTGGHREIEIELLRGPRVSMMDGLLFSPLGLSAVDTDVLDVPYPLVLLGERIFNGPTDHVTMDNVAGAVQATEHLLSLGRRRVAVLGAHKDEQMGSATLRLTGYRQALQAAQVPFDPELVVFHDGWHRTDGADTARELIARSVAFDAIFALNDELALGALRVLHQAGLRVPQDVAVIGFDDVAEAQFAMPSLTTIDPHRARIAQEAVTALVERIAAEPTRDPAPRVVTVPTTLVVRESAPPASLAAGSVAAS
ncbi:MAG: LacI family transcriptional regulator [Actinobacteria bacterium]|nr:LacI family transcriptional regulator [Actinomycetota bacterium]MCG2801862.1 LacI family transcriptional regulator [Cellulomonas sp.]